MLALIQLVYRTKSHTITITVQFSKQNVHKLKYNYINKCLVKNCQ